MVEEETGGGEVGCSTQEQDHYSMQRSGSRVHCDNDGILDDADDDDDSVDWEYEHEFEQTSDSDYLAGNYYVINIIN